MAYLRGGLNQGRSDDSDTAHNADTDRQWHRHHHTPALPPHQSPKYLIGSARITKVVLGSPGEQLLHLLHTSYATGPIVSRMGGKTLTWLMSYIAFSIPYFGTAVWMIRKTACFRYPERFFFGVAVPTRSKIYRRRPV